MRRGPGGVARRRVKIERAFYDTNHCEEDKREVSRRRMGCVLKEVVVVLITWVDQCGCVGKGVF